MIRRPPRSTLFPYTTLFRSRGAAQMRPLRHLPATVSDVQGPGRGDGLAARPDLPDAGRRRGTRSEEHTSELQSQSNLVCRLLLEKKKKNMTQQMTFDAVTLL